MYFVYFLRSESKPEQTYTGYTANLALRLKQHNTNRTGYTTRYRPWKLESFILADTQDMALEVERYFKSTAGKEKFQRFAKSNPDHPNPIEGFFSSQKIGRLFGKRETGFEVKAKTLMLTDSAN